MSKRLTIIALVVALAFVTFVCVEQAGTIDQQRAVMLEMYTYITSGCPVAQ
jgi:hypothetical protein